MATKTALAALGSALLLAGAVRGQPAATPSASEPSPAVPAATAEAKPPAGGNTVSSITVEGKANKPMTACSPRDKDCVAAIVAELKARYPQQLQKWCNHVEERAAMNSMMFMEINLDRPHPNVAPYLPPAVTKVACATDKKP
jgi:hypothetical protein